MRFASLSACFLPLLAATAPASSAADKYNQDDAKALTLKAVALVQAKGLDGARAILDQDGEFKQDELYVKVASEQGEGWVEYRWLNPATKEIGPKITHVKRVPDSDLIAYVGIYK